MSTRLALRAGKIAPSGTLLQRPLSVCSSSIAICQARKRIERPPPLQQKILSGFLNLSSLPYSSYVPSPPTFLHGVDPRIKQVATVMLLWLLTRSGPQGQATIAGFILLATLVNTPWRTARPTLVPLLAMSVLCFLLTSALSDGAPPSVPTHIPKEDFENLPPLIAPGSYSYVLFKFWFLNVTRKSVKLAISTCSLLFVALQSASLCLITTSPEQLALSLRQLMSPLRRLGVPVKEIGFSLLLSIRFLSTVFDEIRNIALGVAVRGIDWRSFRLTENLQLLASMMSQLFRKLFQISENVSQAMVIRGFVGPERHQLYLVNDQKTFLVSNVLSIATLVSLSIFVLRMTG